MILAKTHFWLSFSCIVLYISLLENCILDKWLNYKMTWAKHTSQKYLEWLGSYFQMYTFSWEIIDLMNGQTCQHNKNTVQLTIIGTLPAPGVISTISLGFKK